MLAAIRPHGNWRTNAFDNYFVMNLVTDTHYINQAVLDGPDGPDAVDTGAGTRNYWQMGTRMTNIVDRTNEQPPHLFVHLGDMIDGPGLGSSNPPIDAAAFMAYYDAITCNKIKALGNHCSAYPGYTDPTQASVLADMYGQTDAPEYAGSQFQSSFALTANGVTVRIFVIASTLLDNGNYIARNTGTITEDTKDQIATDLVTYSEDNNFFVLHHGPQNVAQGLFDSDDANDLKNIVEGAIAAQPSRKFTALFGHNHIQGSVRQWLNLGSNFPGYLPPAAIEGTRAVGTRMFVDVAGNLMWEQFPI